MNDQNNNFGNDQTPVNPYKYDTVQSPASVQTYQQPYQPTQTASPTDPDKARSSALKAFIFGIISMELPIFGIIFGAIAKGIGKHILLSKPAARTTYVFARLGRIFGLIGFILNVVINAYFGLIILIAMLASI